MMVYAGCDIGSLTGEAVLLKNNSIIAKHIIRVKANPIKSATAVMGEALEMAGLKFKDIAFCCSTGYGREKVPFADIDRNEIACHGIGAHWLDNSIRSVIDIGGQDCKVISIDENGMIADFIMNDKCAAGTGRSLEILSKSINLELDQLGKVSLKSRHPLIITNKCSIFMEMEVLKHVCKKKKVRDIAFGINDAVAKRVASLAREIDLRREIVITGGVAKNEGVVTRLEDMLEVTFKPLPVDPQLIGALGAAVFAMAETREIQCAEFPLNDTLQYKKNGMVAE
jgi:(R)-2-hydroxyacyl-CoA dehydratese activating ATPase